MNKSTMLPVLVSCLLLAAPVSFSVTAMAAVNQVAEPAPLIHKVEVQKLYYANDYVYVKYTEGKQDGWVAFRNDTQVKVGDNIEFPDSPPMVGFNSKSLKMHFDKLIFAAGFKVVKSAPAGKAPKYNKAELGKQLDVLLKSIPKTHALYDYIIETNETYKRTFDIDSFKSLASIYLGAELYNETIAICNIALKIDELNASAYSFKGAAYSDMNQNNKAIEVYTEAINNNIHDDLIFTPLGYQYLDTEQYKDAVECFNKSLEINNDSPRDYYGLGKAQYHLSDLENAIANTNKAIEISKPDNFFIHRYYEQLGDLNISDAWVRINNKTLAWNDKNAFKAAIDAYKSAIKSKPNSPYIYSKLASAYNSSTRYEDALTAIKEAIRINPDEADFYSTLGMVQGNMHNYPNAIEALKLAVEKEPKTARFYSSLGYYYLWNGDKAQAINIHKQLAKLDKQSADKLFDDIFK